MDTHKKWVVRRTLGGTYGVQREDDVNPFMPRFNLSRKKAMEYARKLNSKKYKLGFISGLRKVA